MIKYEILSPPHESWSEIPVVVVKIFVGVTLETSNVESGVLAGLLMVPDSLVFLVQHVSQ